MKRTYVLNSKVMYTPGEEQVDALVQCVTLDAEGRHLNELQETVTTTQSALGASWGDNEITTAVAGELQKRYPTDEIEVIGLGEWATRWDAFVKQRADEKAAAIAAAAEATAKAAAL